MDGPAAGRLGLGHAALQPGRQAGRHAQGVERDDPVGGGQAAHAGKRFGGPGALDAHRDRRRRLGDPRRLLRAEHPLRGPRARHGRDRERPEPARGSRVRLHVLQLPRLHEGRGPPGGADAPAGDPRLHARLDRAGRGRTDPPAGRAAGAPARHPEHQRPAARGRERDGARLGVRARAGTTVPAPSCSAARTCRSWIPTRSRTTPSSAAPTRCASRRRAPIRT